MANHEEAYNFYKQGRIEKAFAIWKLAGKGSMLDAEMSFLKSLVEAFAKEAEKLTHGKSKVVVDKGYKCEAEIRGYDSNDHEIYIKLTAYPQSVGQSTKKGHFQVFLSWSEPSGGVKSKDEQYSVSDSNVQKKLSLILNNLV